VVLFGVLCVAGCAVPASQSTAPGSLVNDFHVFDPRAGKCIHVTTVAIDARLQVFEVVPDAECKSPAER
jgi:hypothetical protein